MAANRRSVLCLLPQAHFQHGLHGALFEISGHLAKDAGQLLLGCKVVFNRFFIDDSEFQFGHGDGHNTLIGDPELFSFEQFELWFWQRTCPSEIKISTEEPSAATPQIAPQTGRTATFSKDVAY